MGFQAGIIRNWVNWRPIQLDLASGGGPFCIRAIQEDCGSHSNVESTVARLSRLT
jgi:hypothetical protein